MPARSQRPGPGSMLGNPLVGFAFLAFLYFTGEVLKPLALSVLLAFALTPVAVRLERLRLPRALAVVLTICIVLGLMAGIGSVVARQLTSLASQLPSYQSHIETKLNALFDSDATATSTRLNDMVDRVTAKLDKPRPGAESSPGEVQNVRVVQEPSFQERLRASIGPYLEVLGIFSFVLVIVLFMLLHRENLRDRIISLFGHRHVGLTTRTLGEIGGRISRYLVTVALVNSGFGLVIGIGLALIGVPYAVLWGCLAALLRFIPYVGIAVTFGMTTVFAAAHFPGWGQAVAVIALFGVIETILSSILEPVIFGRTTGVSALGLLIAAMFWTWLWGTMGLLLSTPLTVCLAVIGKYVPSLSFFATLLGEEADLKPHLRFYQRIVALDREGAVAVVDEELKTRSRVELYDHVLVPALVRADQDAAEGQLDDAEQAFLWNVTAAVLDRLDQESEPGAEGPSEGVKGHEAEGRPVQKVAGLAQDQADVLILRMLGSCLRSAGIELEVPPAGDSPLEVRETLVKLQPALVLVSHLPSEGLASARYLLRRLRVQATGPPIVVGLWRRGRGDGAQRLMDAGALYVVSSIGEAQERIQRTLFPSQAAKPESAPLPA